MGKTKTDNANLGAKLQLRRYFLDRYHRDPLPSVFDCCQGNGVLWRRLQKDFAVQQYWGVDVKPKPGRVKVKSERVLEQPGWEFDVIDVDTYGSPWMHWDAILANAAQPLTVFLTIGNVQMGGASGMSTAAAEAMGLHFTKMKVKFNGSLFVGIVDKAIHFCLGRAHERFRIVEAMEAERGPKARYIGIRLEPTAPPPPAPLL